MIYENCNKWRFDAGWNRQKQTSRGAGERMTISGAPPISLVHRASARFRLGLLGAAWRYHPVNYPRDQRQKTQHDCDQ